MTEVIAYTIPEFCRVYGIGRSKVYEAINAGQLKARKNGKRTLIVAADAQEWFSALPTIQPRKAA